MKRQLLVSLAALATGLIGLYSCSVKEMAPSKGESEEVRVTVTLDNPATKTQNEGNKTLWSDSDVISAIGTENGKEVFVANSLTYQGNDTFSGRVDFPGNNNDWYFVYPYSKDNQTPKSIHITVGNTQEQTGNDSMTHIAGEGFPLIGKLINQPKSGKMTVNMKNVLTRLDYKVTNTLSEGIIVKQVEFSTPYKISGSFVGDITQEEIKWTAESGTSKIVTLDVQEGTEIAAGQTATFHVGVLPITLAKDESMKVKVVAVDPSAPTTEIVFYKVFSVEKVTPLEAGKANDFTLPFDDQHQTDPSPDTPAGESVYEIVTEEPDSWDGTYLFVDESSNMAFAAFSSNASSYAVNVTISDGKIEATSDIAKYALTVTDAGVKHANATSLEAYNIQNSEDKYIFWSSSTLQILDTNQKTSGGGSTSDLYTYYNTLAYSSNGVQVMSSGHSSNFSKYYLGYASGAFNYDSDGESRRVQLYKLTEGSGTTKEKQTLSFNEKTVTFTSETASGSVAIQEVKGAMTDVTYTSQNESVATVSGTNLIIKGFGSTVITAKAKETDTYKSATASYTFVVKKATTGDVYAKVTSADEIDTEGQYVIVYRNGSTVKAFKPILNSGNTAFSSSTDNAIDVTITDDEIDADAVEDCEIRLANQDGTKFALVVPEADGTNDYYLRLHSSSFEASTTMSTDYLCAIAISDTGVLTITRSGSSTYNFRYSSSNKYFTSSSYNTSSNLELYKLTETSGKQKQTLSFTDATVSLILEEATGSVAIQEVKGAMTTVTYTSENENVATISGSNLIIKGFGSTVITATAKETDEYKSGKASYTLVITEKALEGAFNLENSALTGYLDDATGVSGKEAYTESNTVSYIANYAKNISASNRLDQPAPVTVTWSNPTSSNGSKVVYIYTDAAMTQQERDGIQVSGTSTNSVKVYSLIPGRTYYYKVTNNGSALETGNFSTTGRRRMMFVSSTFDDSHAANCRDFGGLPTTSGKTLKFGKIYRGTNMNSCTEGSSERDILLNYMKIGLDVDLRASNERKNGLGLTSIPSSDNTNGIQLYEGWTPEGYQAYASDLQNTTKIKATLTRIMKAAVNDVNVYIHCRIGADRTGYVCYLVEAILGVPKAYCDIDYELTSFAGSVVSGNRTRNSGLGGDAYTLIKGQSGSSLQEKATNYAVSTLGIEESLIEDFKKAMLE